MTNIQAQDAQAPKAKKVVKELVKHGHTRIDNYYWLNNREDQEVKDYLVAENAYTEEMTKHTKALREQLFEEIKGRVKQTDMSVPYTSRGFSYYSRYEEGQEYPIYCRKTVLNKPEPKISESDGQRILQSSPNPTTPRFGDEMIMINVNEIAKKYDYCSLFPDDVSNDNKLLAFWMDTVGRRRYTLRFKDLVKDTILADEIPDIESFAWSADNKTIFYSKKDTVTLRSYRIYRHVLGQPVSEDELIFEEKDETFSTYVSLSKSRKFIFLISSSTLSSECKFLDTSDPNGGFKMLQAREDKHEFDVYHYQDKFYIRTNLDAQNFRLMATDIDKPGKENWEEIIPNRSDVLLEYLDIFKDYLVLGERKQGLTQIRIRPWDGSEEHYLDFGEETYLTYTSLNPEFDTKVLRYGYTSLTTPNSTYDYNMTTKEKVLLKQQEVVGGHNPEDYEAKRLYAEAPDGKKVPISLVYKKGLAQDASNPVLLYGYGSYGYSMDPYFSSARLSLLDRGFVYAIAHIRGGEDLGREWYDDGKMFKKKNTFTDFIACAEHLIEEKYSNPEKMFMLGGSAGGLLVGAVLNMRPDLFKGAIAAVPFVDVVTTMLDESIPLTTGEYDEWGNPNNKDSYEYILSYSPYDQVKAQDYPNILVTTGFHDSQVQYWEPAKWVAKLREMKTDDNTLLLKTDMDAGHSGKTGRFKRFIDTAFEYAFFLDLAGIKE